jgi:hypothetical protein
MYACVHETGGGSSEGGVRAGEAVTYFSRPTPTTLLFANGSMPAPCLRILTTADIRSLLHHLVLGDR